MPSVYFEASYGGIPLQATSLSTQRGRDINVQSPSRGNKHTLDDRGLRQHVTAYAIRFNDVPGLAPYLDRYDEFLRVAESEQSQIFSHSVDGSYRAKIGPIDAEHDDAALEVRLTCTVYREDEPRQVFPVGAGAAPVAGVESVTVAAAAADEQLADLELESDVPSDMVDAVTEWSEAEDLDSNDVFLRVASLTAELDEEVATLELAGDLDSWQAYETMMLLRYSLARAAEAFTSDAEIIVDAIVDEPRPLLAIAAELYGAEQAQSRADEIARTNRVRTPGLVPRGTTLKIPRPEAS